MNKKGFTVVELLASFTLTMIIVVFLFEIVLQLKELYVNNALKTKVLDQNALIAIKLNSDFDEFGIDNADCNNDSCTLYSGEHGTYSLNITPDNGSVIFNEGQTKEQTISMPKGVSITDVSFDSKFIFEDIGSNKENSYVKVSYKVVGTNLNDPIEFNYVYTYHNDGSIYLGTDVGILS